VHQTFHLIIPLDLRGSFKIRAKHPEQVTLTASASRGKDDLRAEKKTTDYGSQSFADG